ncbi:MAG TPA: carboxypeptidase regulatory-like domain-containing protein [Pyrinomonadaceae bacterium]|nr:carboxypeptidase regulatory-like domain-containing protein [Pyrinomonadaceae bacterium]
MNGTTHAFRAKSRNGFGVTLIIAASLALLFVLTCGATARAQDLDDVSFSGTVVDLNGAVVRGATVTARLLSTGAERTAVTDEGGRYRLFELPPGTYSLRAECAGFAAEERREVSVVAGQALRIDFKLRPADVSAEQTVLSDAAAPAVDTTRTVTGGTLAREEVERLPVFTRSPLDLVFLLGGVTEEPLSTRDAAEDRDPSSRASAQRAATAPEEAGTFALAGGPAYSNNVTTDGLDNNDDRAARERFTPPLDAVEEVQVITNQFSAEYGRASGGRVNLRTRSGSSSLRGRLSYAFTDESLDANTWNNNRRGLRRLPLQEHRPGFTLGGPFVLPPALGPLSYDGRRRTFFFVAYERQRVLDSALIDALVPVEQNPLFPLPRPTTLAGRRFEPAATAPNAPAELAPFVQTISTPSDTTAFTARLDHTYTSAHNGSFLLQLGRARNLRQFGGGLRLAESLQGRRRDTDALAYTDNFVFTPAAVNQLRAQFSRLRPALRATGTGPVVLVNINDPLTSDDPADRSGTLVAGSSTSGATDRAETRLQLQETLTVVRGPHTIKLGADVQRVRSTFNDLADATGTYSFTSAGDFLASAPSRFRQRFGAESVQRNLYTGLFIQTEWRPHARLTLTAGLRYETETVIRDRDNFGPRLALAFDPVGKGKTVLRAGGGIFYNRALLRTVDDFTLSRSVVEFDTDNLPASERRAFIAANLRFPATLNVDSPLVTQYGARLTDFSRRLDPALRIPASYQLNAGFEHELGRGLVVEANYTFNRGIHLWREFNSNAPRLPAGFRDFTAYLLSRDFANFRNASGARPVYNASAAGELVRFTLAPAASTDTISRVVEFGVPISVFNLNSVGSTATLDAALAALQPLRPDPTRVQVEQLISVGNSFYNGLTVEARRRFHRTPNGAGGSLRAAYTLSRLIDDGVVNTSSALRVGDFRGERARSLLDRRHRFVLSTTLDAPRCLGRLSLASVLRLASGAPFNISIGGADRNLDDVSNDRPSFSGDLHLIRWRRPGEALDTRLLESFRLPSVGQTGDLPRNAGTGPGLFAFDLTLARDFRLSEHARLRPSVEFDNVLNKTVFTFGAEFVNFNALRPAATDEQRRAFADSFLVPTRTMRPRTVRVGLRLDF